MPCSEARLAANRANALKSTGPRTEEGKGRSRRNSLQHGLTGKGVVIPGEDAAEIRRESAGLMMELAPDGHPVARMLAERVGTLIVRLKRSARHEFAATERRVVDAALDFDEVRQTEAGRLFDEIDEGTNRADLMTMPEGLDLLDAALAELHAAIGSGSWTKEDSARLVRCLPPEVQGHAEAVGRALIDGDLSGLDRGIVAIMDPANVRGRWSIDQIVGLIEAEQAHLAATRPTLNTKEIERLRTDAINLVLVGSDPESLLARRYEAATERALYRALREIREARKPVEAEPAPMAFPTVAEVARQAEEMRRHVARVEPGPAAKAPALGSIFPAAPARPAAAPVASKSVDAEPAPRGRSRFEDRSKRPKLGR